MDLLSAFFLWPPLGKATQAFFALSCASARPESEAFPSKHRDCRLAWGDSRVNELP